MLLTILFAVAAYAFTATNTVPATRAGDGTGAITGYTVSGVAYTLDAANPANIASWAFDLDAASTSVRSKLVTASAVYTTCVHGAAFHWTCTPAAEPTVASVDQLRVIATS